MGSSSGSGDPFATPDSSSGSSGSTHGDDTGLDATIDDTGAPDGDDGGDSGSECPAYVPRDCGSEKCDLRTHTCCVSVSLQTMCVPGTGSDACPSNQASVHCLDSCECPAGKVCCGVENTLIGAVYSECQAVPNPGYCSPYPQTSTEASAQFCSRDDECRNGQKCIAQTCEFGAMFNICGLQSQDPFQCKADQ
jgi:hypothetical protein